MSAMDTFDPQPTSVAPFTKHFARYKGSKLARKAKIIPFTNFDLLGSNDNDTPLAIFLTTNLSLPCTVFRVYLKDLHLYSV